jgi:predicted DNA-binding transcriptional regulator AlpA
LGSTAHLGRKEQHVTKSSDRNGVALAKPQGRRTAADARASRSPTDRIVFEPERQLITGYSRNWWRKKERTGEAPRRLKLGALRIGWLESELQQWLRDRAAARDAGDDGPPSA